VGSKKYSWNLFLRARLTSNSNFSFFNILLVDFSIDPVDEPSDLGVNARIGWLCAGMEEPGYNSHLLVVDEKGATRVTLYIITNDQS
jgi:hypothetical protein